MDAIGVLPQRSGNGKETRPGDMPGFVFLWRTSKGQIVRFMRFERNDFSITYMESVGRICSTPTASTNTFVTSFQPAAHSLWLRTRQRSPQRRSARGRPRGLSSALLGLFL